METTGNSPAPREYVFSSGSTELTKDRGGGQTAILGLALPPAGVAIHRGKWSGAWGVPIWEPP